MAFVVLIFILFLNINVHFTFGGSVPLVTETGQRYVRDVTACVDNAVCAQLTDICSNADTNLVSTLCPEKCGLCPTPAPTTPVPACTATFCQNSGVCVMVLGKPKCACPDGVSGAHCEHEFEPATPRPSTSTTATTTTTKKTTTTTTASPSLTTTTTLTTAPTTNLLCTVDFCFNAGICVVVLGKPICACPEGITGAHCEYSPATTTATAVLSPSVCDINPCLNGGTCLLLSGDKFECACPKGTMPPLCLPAVAPKTTPTPPPNTGSHWFNPVAPTHSICDTTAFDGCEEAEVVFVVSATRYESSAEVDHELDYIREMVENFPIITGQVRVAVVLDHNTVTEAIHLQDFDKNPRGLINKLQSIDRSHTGRPNIDIALEYVWTTTLKGARPGAKKVVYSLLHLDHFHSFGTNTHQIVNQLKHNCTQMFVLAVGRVSVQAIVKDIPTLPKAPYYHQYQSFAQLEQAGHVRFGCNP